MSLIAAGLWGLLGGLAAGLVAMSAAVVSAKFEWPWNRNKNKMGPYLFVAGVGIVVGTIVAAAAHTQMTGAWPAFLMGVSAPSVIRTAVSKTEVTASTKPAGESPPPPNGDEHASTV